jgi:hypothetical protein
MDEMTGKQVLGDQIKEGYNIRCVLCGNWTIRARQGTDVETNCPNSRCGAALNVRVNGQIVVTVIRPGKQQA